MLCRVFLDLYDDESYISKLEDGSNSQWTVRVDGIEGTAAYIPFIPSWAYDDVSCGNALDLLRNLHDDSYDLVIALAILEHFDQDEGLEFLSHLKRIGKKCIISVPKKVMPQEVTGYPYETHRSHWSDTDLAACGFNRFIPHFGVWIAIHDPEVGPVAQVVRQATQVKQALNFSGESSMPYRSADTDLVEIGKSLGTIMDSLSAIREQQEITNSERLSIKYRLRSWMPKLKVKAG
ncbi:methyltransferase domain-containing protein [Imhoffiella purpurea]|uniref:class I SAM-dependent methyltransferase n=1 Tax=Imhoffiella purpurea TaxID=1249627 RepID=UPI0005C1F3C8|nr:class I SAM-dependent methyltransferase [Imhoffiella purpurea]